MSARCAVTLSTTNQDLLQWRMTLADLATCQLWQMMQASTIWRDTSGYHSKWRPRIPMHRQNGPWTTVVIAVLWRCQMRKAPEQITSRDRRMPWCIYCANRRRRVGRKRGWRQRAWLLYSVPITAPRSVWDCRVGPLRCEILSTKGPKVGHVERNKHLRVSRRWRGKWLDRFCQTMWSADASGILSSVGEICIINCLTERYNTIYHKDIDGIFCHDITYQVHRRGREASPTEIAGQARYVWWKPRNTVKGKLTVRQAATTYCAACSECRELIGTDIKGRDIAAVAPSDREWPSRTGTVLHSTLKASRQLQMRTRRNEVGERASHTILSACGWWFHKRSRRLKLI